MKILVKIKFTSVLIFLIILLLLTMNLHCSYVTYGISLILQVSFPGAIYFVETDKKLVALTIDDGPDPETTKEILKVLNQYDAKATFFVISSNIPGNESIVTQIIRQGHELGNHTTHDEPSIKLTKSEFIAKFNEADKVLSRFAEVRWFRPGSGWYSSEMISFLVHDERGYLCALGSVYPFDTSIPWSFFSTLYISLNARPGSIIILHDRGNRGKRTVKTLKRILPKLKRRGIKVVTLTELYYARSKR